MNREIGLGKGASRALGCALLLGLVALPESRVAAAAEPDVKAHQTAAPEGSAPTALRMALLAGALADRGRALQDPWLLVGAARLARLAGARLSSEEPAGQAAEYAPTRLFADARAYAGADADTLALVESAIGASSRHVLGDGSVLGKTDQLRAHGLMEIALSCKGGERMWAAVRPIRHDASVAWDEVHGADYPLELQISGPDMTALKGMPDNDSRLVSWVPPKDGHYRALVRNLSPRPVYFQYSGSH